MHRRHRKSRLTIIEGFRAIIVFAVTTLGPPGCAVGSQQQKKKCREDKLVSGKRQARDQKREQRMRRRKRSTLNSLFLGNLYIFVSHVWPENFTWIAFTTTTESPETFKGE